MTALSLETSVGSANPIDLVEEIVQANEWAHDRSTDDEMVVEVSGRWCDYRLLFLWQREMNALHYSCAFEMKVPRARRAAVYELLAVVNERLWFGHFDLASDDHSPAFRLLRQNERVAHECYSVICKSQRRRFAAKAAAVLLGGSFSAYFFQGLENAFR